MESGFAWFALRFGGSLVSNRLIFKRKGAPVLRFGEVGFYGFQFYEMQNGGRVSNPAAVELSSI